MLPGSATGCKFKIAESGNMNLQLSTIELVGNDEVQLQSIETTKIHVKEGNRLHTRPAMIAKNTIRVAAAQIRCMATEAPAKDSNTMENLLSKLAAITKEAAPNASYINMTKERAPMKSSNRSNSKSSSQGDKFSGEKKSFGGKNNKRNDNYNPSNKYKKNGKKQFNKSNNERRGYNASGRGGRTVQTVSHFDRIRNPTAAAAAATATATAGGASSGLNSEGLSFADQQEQRALFIRRKLEPTSVSDSPSFPAAQVFKFLTSRVAHEHNLYKYKGDKFAEFKEAPSQYQLAPVSKAELELTKDKMGYDAKSRVLRALEQITTKRGFKLLDAVKTNVPYIPYNSMIYPYANTTLPNNLRRPVANIKNLSNVSSEEVAFTIATVVKGKRQELQFDASAQYKTPQLKVNAQVVVNGLNRNAQLQVDNLHYALAPTMLGEAPVKSLPKAELPPKKL